MNDKIGAIGSEIKDNEAIKAIKKLWEDNQNGNSGNAAIVAQAHPNSVFGNGFTSNNNTQNA